MSSKARRRSAQVAVVVGLLILLVWWLLDPRPLGPESESRSDAPPSSQAVTAGTTLNARPKPCERGVSAPFTPTRVTVPGVTRDANVLALPRDAENVPSAPPISDVGKTEFAWSLPPDPRPGSAQGNALFNAHTWPDGTALGNKLLAGLQVGDRIMVHGRARNGRAELLCYRVTKRVVILASDGSFEYYRREGPPQLALIVCSWPRLGPGNWLHRTIWYASPIAS